MSEVEGSAFAPWPLTALDVPALRAAGRRPVPLRQFVLKVHSRCNLACTYCYIYQGRDRSWRGRPARAATATMRRTAQRIAEHVDRHGLREVRVDLHGGEPLMNGPEAVLEYAAAVRAELPEGRGAHITVQTNGTLLTAATLDRLAAAGIRVGLSLDGGTAALNSRRTDHAGRPSWPAASRAARLLAARPDGYAGLLCTIDLAADPALVYHSLAALRPPSLDLLLPHANWTAPPPGLPHRAPWAARGAREVPYGQWLATVFDLWWDGEPGPRVRLFSEIIALLLGLPSRTESVGLSPSAALVVDTDGAIEQVDSLKTAYEHAPATGLDVFRNTFDQALDHPGVAARQLGIDALGAVCRGCPVVRVCGGGNYTHRYLEGSGFRQPSVYCADLEHLIRHIAHRLDTALTYHNSVTLPDRESPQRGPGSASGEDWGALQGRTSRTRR
ncbi:FxsB family cyclophane-forming radical SAM/SPASM peptide maturase [Streptantibioticus rubrisoli]|uniref:FxsB family radical SAM/SPASM domain protein n=1 Tax=Streptantibioticus rubrisoli TaxID=1387313 RepID=A0ABT1PBS5_9ACTN|nr:FxsB family cyclophane-forming radical SAM/SPASM peptide maturase [Streptantibioticus rubrisoli]MCQ4042830.1 FxsB family radical SAM/SPASM domain protein [Streptantibioticus rubrisoli]